MKLSKKVQEALREQQEINLSDPAVQKRLAAQWGYVPAGAQPAPSVQDVPAKSLKPVIDWLRNGCDPMKAADELEILIAAAPETKPAPIVPDGWKLVPIDPTRNMLDILDLGSNMMYRYRALLAAAPETKT